MTSKYQGRLYEERDPVVDDDGTQRGPMSGIDAATRAALNMTEVPRIDVPPADRDNYARTEAYNGTEIVATYSRLADAEIKVRTNARIETDIQSLERREMLPRVTREFTLQLIVATAAGQGLTEPQLYAVQAGYKKLKDFDAQIVALRGQRIP